MAGRTRALPTGHIETRIFFVRGQRVMPRTHLAEMHEVGSRALVQAVVRNRARCPRDFMFQVESGEFSNVKSQSVISRWGGLRRAAPYAFTEQGIAMLASVLRSTRAIRVSIEVMRAFVRLRHRLASNAELARKLAELEKRYATQFKVVFDAVRELMTPHERPRRQIGLARREQP